MADDQFDEAEGLGRDPSRVQPGSFDEAAASPTRSAGYSGTVVYAGYVSDGEKDATLSGQRRYVTYSQTLANVSIVGAGVRYFLNLVSRPAWKLEPADVPGRQAEADDLAERAQGVLYSTRLRTPWHRVVRRAATFRFYGFSLQEMTALRLPDGTIGLADVAARPQSTIERWDVDERGVVYGAVQTSPTTSLTSYLPRWKLVYAVDDALSDSPEGLGLFRQIADSARRLRRYEQLEGMGYETDLRGIPVGRAPLSLLDEMVADKTITEGDRTLALQGLNSFLQGHVRQPNLALLLDSMTYEDLDSRKPSQARKWDVELLKAESESHAEILRAIDRLNREIARLLGVEQLLLGDNGGGSFAMAKEKSHNFAVQVDSTLEDLRQTIRADVLGFLWRLNGWDEELMPTIKVDRLQFRDVEQVASSLQKLAQAGAMIVGDDPAVLELRDQMGLSRPIEIVDPMPTATPAPEEEPDDDE